MLESGRASESDGASGEDPAANARDTRDTGSNPGWGRSPGGGHANPLQYSCLENPMDSLVGSLGLQRVGHNWSETFSFLLWKVSIWNIYSISWMRKLRLCMGKNFKVMKQVCPFDHILCSTLSIKTGPFHKMWGLGAARNSGDRGIERLQTPRLSGIWHIK